MEEQTGLKPYVRIVANGIDVMMEIADQDDMEIVRITIEAAYKRYLEQVDNTPNKEG